MSTVTLLDTYLQGLHVPSHHQCIGYVQVYMYMYMFKILRQTVVWNNLSWKYLRNNYINEGEKLKTSFEAFLSACNYYFYPKK